MLVIGLTGGIGSGKSTVAQLFREYGANIVDTDAINHSLMGPDQEATACIREQFGETILRADGSVDRNKLRATVFKDDTSKRQLEAILHPRIQQIALQQIAQLANHRNYIILVVPLLFETQSYRKLIQRSLVVDCAENLQISRVMQRNQFQPEQIAQIMQHQLSRQQRQAQADDCINNDGDIAALREQVKILAQKYSQLAQSLKQQ